MQNGRLFEIIYILLERGTVKARELAERFEVTVRTIYRDVELLSAAGIPVYMERGRYGGIRLLSDFVLDKTILTQAEKEEILSSLAGLSVTGQDEAGGALKKLASLFGETGSDWIEVDFSGWGWRQELKDRFALLKEAVIKRHVLSFEYYSLRSGSMTRIAEPLKLVFRGQAWYLYAYCRTREANRFFKLTRMKNLIIYDESFIRRAPMKVVETTPSMEEKTIFVRFAADKSAAFMIYDVFAPDAIQVKPDHTLLVEANIGGGDWLEPYFLSFGASVEIIEPEWLRDNICKTLDEMKKRYNTK